MNDVVEKCLEQLPGADHDRHGRCRLLCESAVCWTIFRQGKEEPSAGGI